MNIRNVTDEDYRVINSWYKGHGIKVIEKRFLPENGLGGLILEKDKPIAVAYIYTTNSKRGYIDCLISDPNYKSKDRYDVILELFKACTQKAFDLGCESVWAQSSIKGVTERAKEIGWTAWGNPHTIITINN